LPSYVFVRNSSKPSAAVHELSCAQAFLPYLTMVKNPKIMSCDLDLWLWNSLGVGRLWRYIVLQNFIKVSAAVHELSTVT